MLNLIDYYGFVYFTGQQLMDTAYNVDGDIQEMFSKAMAAKLNTDLIQSNSSDVQGILNTPSLVTQTKETSGGNQTTANPVLFANAYNMWSKLYPDCQSNAVWITHPQNAASLISMAFTKGGSQSAYGLSFNAAEKYPLSLFGRPVLSTFFGPSAPGVAGDFILADLSQMVVVTSPYQVDFSPHIEFKTNQVAYRFWTRIAIKSPWLQSVTGPSGSQGYSPFITRETLSST